MRFGRLPALLVVISVLFSMFSCSNEQAFEYCELGIVLTNDFDKYESNGAYDAAYADGELIVGMTRISFVESEEFGILTTHTPEKFARVYCDTYVAKGVEIFQHKDVPYYSYVNKGADGYRYFYMLTFYRTPFSYFIITFITPEYKLDVQKEKIFEYIETVYILPQHI